MDLEQVTRDNMHALTEEDWDSVHAAADAMKRYLNRVYKEALAADAGRRREAMLEARRRNRLQRAASRDV